MTEQSSHLISGHRPVAHELTLTSGCKGWTWRTGCHWTKTLPVPPVPWKSAKQTRFSSYGWRFILMWQ